MKKITNNPINIDKDIIIPYQCISIKENEKAMLFGAINIFIMLHLNQIVL